MQSAFRSRDLVKIIAVVQILLALGGLLLLFETEFATYEVSYRHTDLYGDYVYHSYDTIRIWYNENAAMWLVTAGFIVLFVYIALFGFRLSKLSPGQSVAKYYKSTMVLGLLVIVLSAVAAAVAFITRADAVAVDGLPSGYKDVSWSLGTALTSFLVGGFLFVVIGFIGPRITRLAQAPPPPPPLLPPPPPP